MNPLIERMRAEKTVAEKPQIIPAPQSAVPQVPAVVCGCGSNLYWQSAYGKLACWSCSPPTANTPPRRSWLVRLAAEGLEWCEQTQADREALDAYRRSEAARRQTANELPLSRKAAAGTDDPMPEPPKGARVFVLSYTAGSANASPSLRIAEFSRNKKPAAKNKKAAADEAGSREPANPWGDGARAVTYEGADRWWAAV